MLAALIIMGLCPTIYTTVRTRFLGQMPNEWSYSIAGQLSWVNLIYEIVNEGIILPLFFFMGNVFGKKDEFTNRIKTGLISVVTIYAIFSFIVILFVEPMLHLMSAPVEIIKDCIPYIRIEAIANIFGILVSFLFVSLVTIGKDKYIYVLTLCRLLLSVLLDTFLVSALPISFNLGVNGIGYTNITVNFILFITSILLIKKDGYAIFSKTKVSFTWMRNFVKIGLISGLESFVRNAVYIVMISRMVNMVGEQGTYWVANNFIWGWLLLPVSQLGELIKNDVAKNKDAISNNIYGYFAVTGLITLSWIFLIPIYKPFMQYVLGFPDVDKLINLVVILLGSYIAYAFQNIFDSIFYGRGAIQYILWESVVTNTIYYGICFITYMLGMWMPTLTGIAVMFGCGNIFDSVVSLMAYQYFKKKNLKG